MTSLSHWGMFDIDQMYREAYPLFVVDGELNMRPGGITLTVRDSRGINSFEEWAALPPEKKKLPSSWWSDPAYQRLNFGPDLP